MEEKIYTIPLLRAKMAPRTRRAKKAVRLVREFLKKHTKAEIVKIDKSVNERIWARGLRKVPSKIRVKVVKVEEEAWAYAPEAEVKIGKEKKIKEEKERKEEAEKEEEAKVEEKAEETKEEKEEEKEEVEGKEEEEAETEEKEEREEKEETKGEIKEEGESQS